MRKQRSGLVAALNNTIKNLFVSQPWIFFGLGMLFIFVVLMRYFNSWTPHSGSYEVPSQFEIITDDTFDTSQISQTSQTSNMLDTSSSSSLISNNNNINNNDNNNNNNINLIDTENSDNSNIIEYIPQKLSYDYSNRKLRIILSIATGVDSHRIYLYMSSFRKHHPNSDIYKMYLFTDFKDKSHYTEYKRLADEFKIDLVDVDPIQNALDTKYSEYLKRSMKYIKINKRRFFMLFYWIEHFEYRDNIELIMLCDTNDVLFQGNIFSLADETIGMNEQISFGENEIFWFFMEAPGVYMDNEKWNRRYIKYCFGNATITEFINKHVSCSGTSLATFGAMYHYLELMNEILLQQGPKFDECLVKPGDQGLHNIILHRKYLELLYGIDTVRVPNDAGWVLQITTMINHPEFKHKVPQMAENSIVVHQWKWARTVKEKYEKEYDYLAFCRSKRWQGCVGPTN